MASKVVWPTVAALALLALSVPATAQEETCDGPKGIQATVTDQGILVGWDEWSFARAYELYRSEGGGPAELVAVTSGDNPDDGVDGPHTTTYMDKDAEAGVSYTYHVQALGPPPHVSDVCGDVTATAIPVFPTLLVGAAAMVVGAGAYVALRRRP